MHAMPRADGRSASKQGFTQMSEDARGTRRCRGTDHSRRATRNRPAWPAEILRQAEPQAGCLQSDDGLGMMRVAPQGIFAQRGPPSGAAPVAQGKGAAEKVPDSSFSRSPSACISVHPPSSVLNLAFLAVPQLTCCQCGDTPSPICCGARQGPLNSTANPEITQRPSQDPRLTHAPGASLPSAAATPAQGRGTSPTSPRQTAAWRSRPARFHRRTPWPQAR